MATKGAVYQDTAAKVTAIPALAKVLHKRPRLRFIDKIQYFY